MTEPTHGTRRIELSIEVPGTPEEVWDTIATGPGITSWFVPHEVEERTGGAVSMDFGEGLGTFPGEVTVWDPPRRFVLESGEPGQVYAYEWLVEGGDGGSCVVRLVNSGFGEGAEWDGEYDGMTRGWKVFLDHLRLQLTHFRGRRSRTLVPTAMVAGPSGAAWTRLCEQLGVADDLRAGDRFEAAGDGVPPLAGTVESVLTLPDAREYLLLLDAPHPGTAFVLIEGDGEQVSASLYLYLYGDEARTADDVWSPWFHSAVGPAPTPG